MNKDDNMQIDLRVIDRTNYMECIQLEVLKEQETFVATNMFSLIQAAYEPELYPLGVYNGNKMVGFILYDFDYEINGWSMSRFMIDKNHQNQGIGACALQKFIKLFSNKHGAKLLYTSVSLENHNVISLYEKHGFEKREPFEYEHGGKTYKELRMLLKL